MSTWEAVAVGIIPSLGVGLLFWYVMRAVIRADRRERAAIAEQEAAIDAAEAAAMRAQSADAGAGEGAQDMPDAVAGDSARAPETPRSSDA